MKDIKKINDLPKISPHDLAALLPLNNDDVLLYYHIGFDPSFENPEPLTGIVKYSRKKIINGENQQFKVIEWKNDPREFWSIGFNLFKEGEVIRYQSFYWLGEQNNTGRINEDDTGQWKVVGPVQTLNVGVFNESKVHISGYEALSSRAKPLFPDFHLDILSGEAKSLQADPNGIVIGSKKYRNDTDKDVTITHNIDHKTAQTIQTSLTDTNSYHIGVKLGWAGGISWAGIGHEYSIDLEFNYSSERSTTASYENSDEYTISDTVSFKLAPNEEKYISLVLINDQNARGQVDLEFELKLKINDIQLSGEFLRDMVLVNSHTDVTQVNYDNIIYVVSGGVVADLIFNWAVEITNEALSLDDVRAIRPWLITQR